MIATGRGRRGREFAFHPLMSWAVRWKEEGDKEKKIGGIICLFYIRKCVSVRLTPIHTRFSRGPRPVCVSSWVNEPCVRDQHRWASCSYVPEFLRTAQRLSALPACVLLFFFFFYVFPSSQPSIPFSLLRQDNTGRNHNFGHNQSIFGSCTKSIPFLLLNCNNMFFCQLETTWLSEIYQVQEGGSSAHMALSHHIPEKLLS